VVDKAWLEAQLAAGRSYESIGHEVDRHASTVAYWARKHGLTSAHTPRHAARGPIERELLAEIVACGLPVRDMADVIGRSPTTVRHWSRRHGLTTEPAQRAALAAASAQAGKHELRLRCKHHGMTRHVLRAAKRFALSRDGVTRSLARAREEAAKCVLLCANCHAEVEAGLAQLPLRSADPQVYPA
jgi:transposase